MGKEFPLSRQVGPWEFPFGTDGHAIVQNNIWPKRAGGKNSPGLPRRGFV